MRKQPLPTVCILAGGLGTRLGDSSRSMPKCLTEIAGRPFLEYQLELLASHGAARVVLCVGHLGDRVVTQIGPQRCGLAVDYSFDGPGLDGTLGAIRKALPLLGDRFLVLYGDTYLRVDIARFRAVSQTCCSRGIVRFRGDKAFLRDWYASIPNRGDCISDPRPQVFAASRR